MNKLHRAIVIDPAARTIEEVQSNGSHEDTCRLVGAASLDHFMLADHDTSWDFGWCYDFGLADERPIHAFLFSIRTDPIAGRCALIGAKKGAGTTCDALFPLEVLKAEITWLGLILPKVTWIDNERGGGKAVVSFQRIS